MVLNLIYSFVPEALNIKIFIPICFVLFIALLKYSSRSSLSPFLFEAFLPEPIESIESRIKIYLLSFKNFFGPVFAKLSRHCGGDLIPIWIIVFVDKTLKKSELLHTKIGYLRV